MSSNDELRQQLDAYRLRVEHIEGCLRQAREERDEWLAKAKLSAQVASAWESLYRERQFAVDRVDAVLEILAATGCDCECHDGEEHDEDCERCLACRIEQAVRP
jgi:hypothetical protein